MKTHEIKVIRQMGSSRTGETREERGGQPNKDCEHGRLAVIRSAKLVHRTNTSGGGIFKKMCLFKDNPEVCKTMS